MIFKKASLFAAAIMLLSNVIAAKQSVIIGSDKDQPNILKARDIYNATPMPLPTLSYGQFKVLNVPRSLGDYRVDTTTSIPRVFRGYKGNGRRYPRRGIRGMTTMVNLQSDDVSTMEYGSNYHPFNTSRVDGYGNRNSREYPFSPTGKLYFSTPRGTSLCSASLIKKGVIVTAAHCVWARGEGANGHYRSFRFEPAKYHSNLPYGGAWIAYDPMVLTSHVVGTAKNCQSNQVVCDNDIAVLRVQRKKLGGRYYYPGELTGWYGYGIDGYGFTKNANPQLGNNITQITQLGYPASHDKGFQMQQTNSLGYISGAMKDNIIIGSRQTGGSSGGPWIVNHGSGSTLEGTSPGSDATRNVVVGVSSWGYINGDQKIMGASLFTSSNILPLINAVCNGYDGC